ncbi:hypothetical protein C1645_752475 [Glomus cerebriforme]|uniref:Uncharacterized protein n=1 Tax=Glomus cerebriforme TaxID=658196 RepID=A0A397TLC9_9GLOM|nr:hypothetical protein C1645_752475 [Glomus cerebriforme]
MSSENSEHLDDPDFLKDFVSSFGPRDVRSLRVNFRPGINVQEVIPYHIPPDRVNIPQEYALQDVNRALLQNENLDIAQLSQNDYVRSFIKKLHEVILSAKAGSNESWTNALVSHILYRVFDFDKWPLGINPHPRLKFMVGTEVSLTAIPEYVVKSHDYILLVVEDKHLNNNAIGPTNDYGEPQIAGEILACGNENVREARISYDVTVFVARVISTYVTFYRTTIKKEYWNELADGCPRVESITVARWPVSSDPLNGFDLAEPNGRRAVFEALCRIFVVISEYRP